MFADRFALILSRLVACPTLLAAGFLGAVLLSSSASAELRLCNKTQSRVGVAIGYNRTGDWVTEGWWNVGPAQCETLLTGELDPRYYYYVHAVDYDRGGAWGGDEYMCTSDKEFEIAGTKDCIARGHRRTGFLRVDIGEQTTWIVQLMEPGESGMGGR